MTRATLENDGWSAFQFHREDLHAGILLLFRRAVIPYEASTFRLRGLDPAACYRLTLSDEDRNVTTAEVDGAVLLAGALSCPVRARAWLWSMYESGK